MERNGLDWVKGFADKSIINLESEERRHLRRKVAWTMSSSNMDGTVAVIRRVCGQ